MRKLLVLASIAILAVGAVLFGGDASGPTKANELNEAVKGVVREFQEGLATHDLARIEPLMAADMVAFENGRRDDTWAGFRDDHMKPEFEGPPAEQEWELIRVSVSDEMAWAYTKTDLHVTRKNGEKLDLLLWTIYTLEMRDGEWKIVMLDWSMGRVRNN